MKLLLFYYLNISFIKHLFIFIYKVIQNRLIY